MESQVDQQRLADMKAFEMFHVELRNKCGLYVIDVHCGCFRLRRLSDGKILGSGANWVEAYRSAAQEHLSPSPEGSLVDDLWWFIENVGESDRTRHDRFFRLRQRVRLQGLEPLKIGDLRLSALMEIYTTMEGDRADDREFRLTSMTREERQELAIQWANEFWKENEGTEWGDEDKYWDFAIDAFYRVKLGAL